MAAAIRSTQAYADAAVALVVIAMAFSSAGLNYGQLRQRWSEQPPNGCWFSITTTAAGCAPELA